MRRNVAYRRRAVNPPRLTVRTRFGMESAAMRDLHTRIRRRVAVLAMVTSTVACAGTTPLRSRATAPGVAPPSSAAAHPHQCPASASRSVVARANAARRRAHLGALVADPRLTRAAYGRASAMAAQRRLSHSGWEPVVRGADAPDGSVGENIAYNYPTAEAVMRGWLSSSGHRANILQPAFHRIGVGCIVDAAGARWWTQDFAD
jgi:uncharacterized protein YkwD